MPNPSIVLASLDDEKLRQSITNLVAHVKRATHTMLTDTNSTVDAMEKKLKSLGNIKIGSGGTNDGGIAKQTKAQNEFTDAVKKSTNEIKRQGKEGEMSFDQIASALDKARRTVSEFNTKRASGILPSSEDYKRYEQALARIVEYNDKLKQSALSRADANQWANVFDARRNVKDLFSTDERLKQLNKYYAEQEKLSQKATQDEERQRQKRVAAMEKESAAQKKMIDDQYKLSFARTMKIPTDQLDLAQAKLERLQALLRDMRERGILSNTQIASTEAEIRKLEQIIGQVNTAQQQTTQSAQRYTEEIRKQAAAIRATKTWQEQGFAEVNGHVFKDPERVKGTMQLKREIGTLEEQILRTMQQQSIAERANTQEAQKHLDTIKEIAAAARAEMKQYGMSAYNTGYAVQNPYIYAENDARAKGLTIEQQIEKVLREEAAGYQASARSAAMVVEEEKKITQEQDKRKSYKAPVTTGNESFKQLTANALGVQPSEIDSTSTKIAKMTAYVRQLETAYSNLKIEERSTPFGKQLREEIQTTSRTIQKFRSEISRPINLQAALQGSEKTLDDIAYKIQRLQSYKRGIDITDPKQAGELRTVDAEINRLTKDLNKYMSTTRQASEVNNALSRSWNYMKNRLAFYFTVGASTQFIKNLIEVRSQYELNERALGILINSAERGTQIFNELSQMALVSPYTLIELSSAAKQLTAYGIAARDVVDTTRRLADMASAVGVPMERLTYALGQIKAYGYLNSRDQRMFANAGIPLAAELAKYYTEIEGKLVSTADVYDRIKKKAVDYSDVVKVINKMTDEGGKFYDFQAKMADTLKVRLANLTLAWNNMLNDMGKETQGFLQWTIGGLKTIFLHWKEIRAAIYSVAAAYGIVKAVQMFMVSRGLTEKYPLLLKATAQQMGNLGNKTKGFGTALKEIGPTAGLMLLVTWIISVGTAIYQAHRRVVEFNESLRDSAKNNFNDISKFVNQYRTLRDSLGTFEVNKNGIGSFSSVTNINEDEAKKAWEAMREQIELSSAASDSFIGRLLTIKDINERLRTGFSLLNDIQQANAAMKALEDTTISVSQSYSGWWNAWMLPDGLDKNIKDYTDAVKGAGFSWEYFGKQIARTLIPAGVVFNAFEHFHNNEEDAFDRLNKDIDKTSDSLLNFIKIQGLANNPTAIEEVYAQFEKKIATEGNYTPEQQLALQRALEEGKADIMREALAARIADENAALQKARDENAKKEINARLDVLKAQESIYRKSLDSSRADWNDFTTYLKERHMSEMQQMFGSMDAEQIKSLNFQEGKYAEWVRRMVENYATSHNKSYDEVFNHLKDWVADANMWKIFIGLTISTEGQKSITDLLVEYDQQADTALTKIQRNQRRLQEMVAMGWNSAISNHYKEYSQLKRETDDLIANYNDVTSKEKGGHAKQADKANEKAAKAAAAARKKGAAATAKAERQAETELAKALDNEIQLINEAKSEYKKLEDAGYETFSALEIIQKRFSQSVKNINAVLAKNNIPLFDLSKFTGTSNPRFLLNMLEKQIKALKNNPRVKAAETQKFEIEFSKVDIDAKAYDSKKIAEGLDNSLSRLKDEYELAIALDADPELGNLFADWMGIDTSVLPRTVQEYAERATKYLNQYLKENKAELTIPDILNLTSDDMRAFEEGVETARYNKEWVERIKKTYEDAANYRKKDMEETIKGWNSLLEKYSDYQHQLVLVQKNASQERLSLIKKFGSEDEKSQGIRLLDAIKVENSPEEVAKLVAQLKDLADKVSQNDETAIKLNVAIDQKALEETSKITFEEFQKTPQWMMATGDLASMTDNMIKMLIQDLEKYKRVNKKALSTKDLRQLQKTLNALHRQARRGNPFHAIADAMDEAKERASEYDDKISETENKLAKYGKLGRELTEEEAQEVERLRNEYARLKKEKEEASKPNAEKIVASIKEAIGVAQEAIGMFSQMAEAIGGKGMTDAAQNLNKVVGVLQMAAEGAAIGAKLGNGKGAAIGAAAGGLMGVITQFADELSGNARINRAIKRSELAVKRLELAYLDLEEAENKAYGTAVIGAKQAVRANKELQLAELRRQLVLEQSRKKKNRDENRILELKQQIKELQYEIKNASVDIINELFGQQSAGDFAEQLVSNMIDAFRQGEDYMKSFYDSFDEMVDNMIMKSITSRVVADYIDSVWEDMEDRITKRSDDEAKAYAEAQLDVSNYEAFTDKAAAEKQRKVFEDFWNSLTKEEMEAYYKQYYKGTEAVIGSSLSFLPMMAMQALPELYQKVWDDYTNNLYATEKSAKKALDKATAITDDDINYIMDKFSETLPELGEQLKTLIGQYYNIGDKSEKQLSSLQQGIQGITEDQAGALEAYWNINTQEQFKHTTLLTQIRDLLSGPSGDVQIGVQAQMLLQLQQSYQVQMSIHSTLQGWTNPSGQAVRVELIS